MHQLINIQLYKPVIMVGLFNKIIVPVLFLGFLSSCGYQSKEVDSNSNAGQAVNPKSNEVAGIPTNLYVEGDTINLVGKHILFFSPSEAIIKDRKVEKNSLQLFNQIAQSLIDSIGTITSEAKATMTTVGHVRIYGKSGSAPKMIILATFSESFGMIISDGTNLTPITKGVRTREDYERQIRRTLNFENR
ncbi:MAG: hypothetical protein ACK560_01810 [Bacteroidota bacterium]